jgi:hypothetical protein
MNPLRVALGYELCSLWPKIDYLHLYAYKDRWMLGLRRSRTYFMRLRAVGLISKCQLDTCIEQVFGTKFGLKVRKIVQDMQVVLR